MLVSSFVQLLSLAAGACLVARRGLRRAHGTSGGRVHEIRRGSSPRALWLYVGTYTNGKTPSEGIYLLEMDPTSGSVTPKGVAARACRPLVPGDSPQPQVSLRGQRAGFVPRQEGGRCQRPGHRPGQRQAYAPEPAVVPGQRALPSLRGSDGEERAGGQLRQRQRGLPADPGRRQLVAGVVVHPARGQERRPRPPGGPSCSRDHPGPGQPVRLRSRSRAGQGPDLPVRRRRKDRSLPTIPRSPRSRPARARVISRSIPPGGSRT